jgi:hypothetical protein
VMTLTDSVRLDKLQDFIAQEEARGIGPVDRAEFDGAASKVIKARQLEDRTSRSSSGENSSGTETPRDTDQGVSS